MSRYVVKTLSPEEEEDGLGVRVKRTIGGMQLDALDPFLQLDEFTVQKPGCLPDRPSRGFQTLMSSGCGLVHSESPVGEEVAVGVQIFVNVAGEHKGLPPSYQCHPSQDIPTAIKEGVKVIVLVGEAFGNKSQLKCVTPVNICDITVETEKHFDVPFHPDWTVAAFILSGKLSIANAVAQVEAPVEASVWHSVALDSRASDFNGLLCKLRIPQEKHALNEIQTEALVKQIGTWQYTTL